jgi:hypothetical protein
MIAVGLLAPLPQPVVKGNWIKTNHDEYWFACFCLHAPTETYFY